MRLAAPRARLAEAKEKLVTLAKERVKKWPQRAVTLHAKGLRERRARQLLLSTL